MCGCAAHWDPLALCTCQCSAGSHAVADLAGQAPHLAGGAFRLDPRVHPCQLHAYHRPEPIITVRHHGQPLGMGGPDVPANWHDVCDTGHRNVHMILGPMCQQGTPGWGKTGTVGTKTERALARVGFNQWEAAGYPGNPHAAWA